MASPSGRWCSTCPASTGYYTVAKKQIHDARAIPGRVSRTGFAARMRSTSGTHPPGLFLVEHACSRLWAARPAVARWVVDHLPGPVVAAFRAIDAYDPLPMADRATLGLTAALTVLACAATVVPLYLLARANLSAPAAWSAAVALAARPLGDPVPTVGRHRVSRCLAVRRWPGGACGQGRPRPRMACWRRRRDCACARDGFHAGLPAGRPDRRHRAGDSPWARHDANAPASCWPTGAGFLGPTLAFWLETGADPFVIWWWNQRNHARFYVEYHRTYALWLLVNPVELALALGIPATVWAVVGFASVRSVPRVAWATLAVLIFLTASGRSLSEVARLWLPLMPPLLTAAGHGLAQVGAGPRTLAVAVATLGAETLLLEATIQVVYPI